MPAFYMQKVLDIRKNDVHRMEIFSAEEPADGQGVSAKPVGADHTLHRVEDMIKSLIRIAKGYPEETQQIISINIANSILADNELLDIILDNLQDMPYGLSIEVAQVGDLLQPRKVNTAFSALRQRRCSVGFDNFGGAKAKNPQILSEYAFDSVKLHSKFVQGALSDERSLRVLNLVVDLIKAQDKTIIATGVSTREQSEKLASLGIVLQQGDFIHRPERIA
jgi:EAL domain-containing protein (putative c-di-GMP-specific phosphodiesterase class I)